jgi:hypothetical protein
MYGATLMSKAGFFEHIEKKRVDLKKYLLER